MAIKTPSKISLLELDQIEAYFEQTLSDEKKKVFENRINSDKKFAADVAYYIGTRQVIKQLLLKQKQSDWEGYDLVKVDFSAMPETAIQAFLEEVRVKDLRKFYLYLTRAFLELARKEKKRKEQLDASFISKQQEHSSNIKPKQISIMVKETKNAVDLLREIMDKRQ